MLKGLKEKVVLLRAVMNEDDMVLFLLKNGYDLGEGVCEKGQEHLYIADSTQVVEYALELGYEANMNEDEVNVFTNTKMAGTERTCKKCQSQVEFETELDYPYFCPVCDENLYEVETDTLIEQTNSDNTTNQKIEVLFGRSFVYPDTIVVQKVSRGADIEDENGIVIGQEYNPEAESWMERTDMSCSIFSVEEALLDESAKKYTEFIKATWEEPCDKQKVEKLKEEFLQIVQP